MRAVRTALEIVFWLTLGLLVWTQIGYALSIAVLAGVLAPAPPSDRRPRERPVPLHDRPASTHADQEDAPRVSLIVAAHDEQEVIEAKVRNALALEYPRERLELIVACDGCTDATAPRARAAGADLVLELPRGGKIVAQDAAVERAAGELLAFSDANAIWRPDALRALAAAFSDPSVGYACGHVRFIKDAAAPTPRTDNQEGVYWRHETALRARESRLVSITAGNGAIYATRRESYISVDPIMGHDLSFPFNMVKRGWRAVDVPEARATEKMVPSLEGEWRRKRRMMSHTWPIVLRGGMLSPRGYSPGYAAMIFSHRVLRYCTPFLHAALLAAAVALVASTPRWSGAALVYALALVLQLALLVAAALAPVLPARPFLVARYYVLTAVSPAAGLWDWLRHGTAAAWEAAEGTR